MTHNETTRDMILRAWKDEGYRQSLPSEVRDEVPARPEGFEQLDDEQLEQAAGAGTPLIVGAIAAVAGGGFSAANAYHAVTTDS